LERRIKGIAGDVAKSYAAVNFGGENAGFPNKQAVVAITDRLIALLFPGYFGRVLSGVWLEAELLDISLRLGAEMTKALSGDKKTGEDTALALLAQIGAIREIVTTDVNAAYEGDPAATDKYLIITSYPGVFACAVHRLAHALHALGAPYIPRVMSEYAHAVTGIDIHPGAKIGRNFFIDHGTGVVIGETTEIGERVKLYQGVTLGARSTKGGQSLKGEKRHPTIEDDVTIYSGASVLGGETVIGKGATIGGNAFVTASVPPGAFVFSQNETSVKPPKTGDWWFALGI
jgi:serine O-acetyltransferase